MKTLIKLLIIAMILTISNTPLLSQSCEEEEKIINEVEKALDNCHKEFGKTYKECKKQLEKDKKAIKSQKKIIDKLDKKLGSDKMKHRAQGAGGASLLFLLLFLLL